ncbi:hypothetical protein [Aliiglaciecola sp. LCG003]|uniref:hypothetical protein n=1 Tax=Aliiglaciecola sp. LCG003 TaxID=3053655 RepID=UPI002573B2B9|nr:hypothetical protein [Aliiglaciecola sp. LCG003]WJG11018.1 hypothetical protein QR722_08335 [Aliiglaciecola sp. LCG003]
MSKLQFICQHHFDWVEANPKEAFDSVIQMSKIAESLIHNHQYTQALPYLGTALETVEIIFDNRLESPQLTTKLTSLAIMLAQTYARLNRAEFGKQTLVRIEQKLQCAIDCAEGYATKVAFFRHCRSAITEANFEMLGYAQVVQAGRVSALH